MSSLFEFTNRSARICAVAAIGCIASRGSASADERAAPDPIESLLAPNAADRAAAATAVGARDLETAVAALPVLVEALDDESPAARAAAMRAITALAGKAVPTVVEEIASLRSPPAPLKGDMLRALLMLSGNRDPNDFAAAVTGGAPESATPDAGTWHRGILAAAVLGPISRERSLSRRATLRMLAAESVRRSGVAKSALARAAALTAWAEASTPETGGSTSERLPPLSPDDVARLAACLAEQAPLERRVLSAAFLARTGLGAAAVVPSLHAMADRRPPDGGWDIMDPEQDVPKHAVRALALLARDLPAAAEALRRLRPEAVIHSAAEVAWSNGVAPWSDWIEGADAAHRGELAVDASAAGSTDAAVLATLMSRIRVDVSPKPGMPLPPGREIFEEESSSNSSAAEALARFGPAAKEAVPALEAMLDASKERPVARSRIAAALLRIRGAHPVAAKVLAELAASPEPPASRSPGPMESVDILRSRALTELAAAGGPEAAGAARRAIDQLLEHPQDVRIPQLFGLRASAAALASSPTDVASQDAARLARMLSAPFPISEAVGSATSILGDGQIQVAAYFLRSAALDALGHMGAVAKQHSGAIATLLQSRDPRLRWRAAQALRRIGA
jgi:hypothetical protein